MSDEKKSEKYLRMAIKAEERGDDEKVESWLSKAEEAERKEAE